MYEYEKSHFAVNSDPVRLLYTRISSVFTQWVQARLDAHDTAIVDVPAASMDVFHPLSPRKTSSALRQKDLRFLDPVLISPYVHR